MATPRLDGKVAIITRAAGGIGAAAAKAFVGEGALILLTDADADAGRVRHLAAELGDRAGARAHDVTSEDFRRVLDVNTVGVFLGMRALAPAMSARGSGSIINVSSWPA